MARGSRSAPFSGARASQAVHFLEPGAGRLPGPGRAVQVGHLRPGPAPARAGLGQGGAGPWTSARRASSAWARIRLSWALSPVPGAGPGRPGVGGRSRCPPGPPEQGGPFPGRGQRQDGLGGFRAARPRARRRARAQALVRGEERMPSPSRKGSRGAGWCRSRSSWAHLRMASARSSSASWLSDGGRVLGPQLGHVVQGFLPVPSLTAIRPFTSRAWRAGPSFRAHASGPPAGVPADG